MPDGYYFSSPLASFMMLPRKRQRPNPTTPSSTDTPTTPSARSQPAPTSLSAAASEPVLSQERPQMQPPGPGGNGTPGSSNVSLKQVRKSQSWYGSWPRTPKATASTSVARENILGGSVKPGKTPDFTRFEMKRESDAGSIRSTTKGTSGLPKISENKGNDDLKEAGINETLKDDSKNDTTKTFEPDMREATRPAASNEPSTTTTTPQLPPSNTGWLDWWSRTPFTEPQTVSTNQIQQEEPKDEDPPRPVTPEAQTSQPQPAISDTARDQARSTSWFGFWGSNTTEGNKEQSGDMVDPVSEAPKAQEDVVIQEAPPLAPKDSEPAPKAGSTWAFWSKDSPQSKNTSRNEENKEEGEIAVIGEGSEAHPKPMTEGDVSPSNDAKSKKEVPTSGKSTWRRTNKRTRPLSLDIDAPNSQSPTGILTPQEKAQQQPQGVIPAKTDSSSKSVAESELATKAQKNLLLPSFESTYQMKQDPSILKQIAQLVLRTQQSPINQVSRVKDPPKIRKAIAIGVHGLFPATYLRPMIGQPTGTSLRFASLGADAIRRWTETHGSPNCDIEKVALEGEGKINERVDNLWKLMLNWIDHIRRADLILIACHSQGVPVSIMLLEKLIDLGIVTSAKIGVCAMAGVALGPFPEYKSGILMGSAAELWDFGNPETANAQRFEASLKRVLDYGARITFIGSIDDQLVPMESAIYSPASHPYIYRAVFIDGRVHAPDFIAHLIGFALKLRNLGISDHGLIRELSVPLAGSLYSGEGHSRLYYDDQVYDLALSHALETTSSSGRAPPTCEIHHRGTGVVPGNPTSQSAGASNPYVLPWIMRGLLEEDFVKTELSHETEELLRQFDDWKPSNKALKDVKYRLEAVRSKL